MVSTLDSMSLQLDLFYSPSKSKMHVWEKERFFSRYDAIHMCRAPIYILDLPITSPNRGKASD